MALTRILLFYVSCLIVLAYARTELIYDQDNRKDLNVCKTKVTYPVEVVTTELQNYQVRTNNWCFNVPPRCSSYKLQTRVVNKTSILMKERFETNCCEGYKRNPVDDSCIPECKEKCVHGSCVAPNKCKCEHGYGGPSCDIKIINDRQSKPVITKIILIIVAINLIFAISDTEKPDYER